MDMLNKQVRETLAVRFAHPCAMESPRVKGEMIEASGSRKG